MKRKGFTLAETMIVLIVIGVVAAITLPAMMERSNYNENMTKVKKAIADYEKIVSQIRIAEGLTKVEGESLNSLDGFVKGNNYENGRAYFKIKANGSAPYEFQTSDGVWWNIQTMSKPIIAIDDDCKSVTPTHTKSDACYNKSFYLTTTFNADNGNAFVVNGIDTDAKYALYYAKLIELSLAQQKAAAGELEYITDDGVKYTKKTIDASITVDLDRCYYPELLIDQTCTSAVKSGELYYSAVIPDTSSLIQNTEGANNWEKAKNYCKKNGGRLPTVAELKAGNYPAQYWSSEYGASSNWHGVYTLKYGNAVVMPETWSLETVCVSD